MVYPSWLNLNETIFILGFFNAVINALNIIQIGSSTFTFLLVLVVVLPVKYVVKSKDYSGLELVFRTALDPMCLYYGGYLIFSILGVSGKSGGVSHGCVVLVVLLL